MILRAFAAIILLALAGCVSGAPRAAPTQAQTTSGRVEGILRDGVMAWLGLPYAAPPTGDLRWKPPAPAPGWEGVKQTSSFAPACLQTGVSMPGEAPPSTSEDCLYLNIWAPAARHTEPLPVIVWIHGGGWTNGATAMPL